MMTESSDPAIGFIRRSLVEGPGQPLPEVIRKTLQCTVDVLQVPAAFLARIDGDALEIIDALPLDGPASRGMRLPLDETFAADQAGLMSVADARVLEPFQYLPMRELFGIVRYLSAPVHSADGRVFGVLAAHGDTPGAFSEHEADLLMVIGALIGSRIGAHDTWRTDPARPRILAPMRRLVTHQLGEPLAVLRGYADMLKRDEIPPAQMTVVARRLATQAGTVLRVVDQMLLLSRLPLELTLTVRVSLDAVLQAVAQTFREEIEAAGMQFRLQLDATGEVWGDAALLQAAVEEMVQNVCKHAATATVVQLRLRQSARDRFQLIVKDNGPGLSAERLAELFDAAASPALPIYSPHATGFGLRLVREVAEAHGGSAWANSVQGKGTTFYMELPAASPDGAAARLPHPIAQIAQTSA